ncbi:unnamed protein product [Amoebophrya sp. A120]|nr:unnamed protein product [Amoebophrya sp. A120]|eukprot:GSA120T00006480001.1
MRSILSVCEHETEALIKASPSVVDADPFFPDGTASLIARLPGDLWLMPPLEIPPEDPPGAMMNREDSLISFYTLVAPSRLTRKICTLMKIPLLHCLARVRH